MPETLHEIAVVGLSHRTASLELRERVAVGGAELPGVLAELADSPDVAEACLLSTCNRTEVLCVARGALDPTSRIAGRLFPGAGDALYVWRGVHAVMHLFRVAGGLDSAVVGESEVLGQLKRAYETARRVGSAGPVLVPLLTQALRVGKRVRRETSIASGSLSVARVGVDLARHAFGELAKCRATILGSGDTGRAVARRLIELGCTRIAFANRTREHAEHAAKELGASAHGLDELPGLLAATDLFVASVECSEPLVLAPSFDRKALAERDRPLLALDLSVPRAVDPEVARLEGLLLYDLDALRPELERTRESREQAVELCSAILVSEVHKFLALRTYASFSPAIAELRRRFEATRDAVADSVLGSHASPREVELAHELGRRLLDIALDQMKDGARRARSEEALDREYRRFLENL